MLINSLDELSQKKITVLINGKKTRTAPSGVVRVSAMIPRIFAANFAKVEICKDFSDEKKVIDARFSRISGCDDIYECEFNIDIGLYYFNILVCTPYGELCFGNDGSELHGRFYFDFIQKFQLLCYDSDYVPPKDYEDGAVYQIFVDRFAKTGTPKLRKDSRYEPDWDHGIPEYAEYPGQHLENNVFFGGTLNGIVEKLDYLSDLGINILYLTPIFKAHSNHRYDTGDYSKVDSALGGITALRKLIKEAHKRGMKILLDGVFNHTGDDSLYFNKYKRYPSTGAYNSVRSPYYSWYTFDSHPDDYKSWWGVKILPTLNTSNPEVIEYFCGENGIIRKYLKEGIDGWRLDVADELSSQLLDGIKAAAKTENPDSMILGEVWEDASNKIAYSKRRPYFMGHQLDSVMNYPLRSAIIDFVKYGNAEDFASRINIILLHYPEHVLNRLLNFLGTHDTERIITVLAGDDMSGKSGSELAYKRMTPEQFEHGKKLVSFAFALLSVCPGMPCIYYGDEIGMQGYRDPFNRMPFSESNGDLEFSKFFASTLTIRAKEISLRRGKCEIINAEGSVVVIRREYENEHILSIFNASGVSHCFKTDIPYTSLTDGVTSNRFDIPAMGYQILKNKKENA